MRSSRWGQVFRTRSACGVIVSRGFDGHSEFAHSLPCSGSAQTIAPPFSSISTWIKFGRQQTGQSSMYSWLAPADRSSGMTISSPQVSQM